MQQLRHVFSGLGGASHKVAYEALLALEHAAQAPKGSAALLRQIKSAFDKDVTSASYTLKRLYETIGTSPEKTVVFDEGLRRGFGHLIQRGQHRDAVRLSSSLDPLYPSVNVMIFDTYVARHIGTISLMEPLPSNLTKPHTVEKLTDLATHYASETPHRLITLAMIAHTSGPLAFDQCIKDDLPSLYDQRRMADDLQKLFDMGAYRDLHSLLRQLHDHPFFKTHVDALEHNLPWLKYGNLIQLSCNITPKTSPKPP